MKKKVLFLLLLLVLLFGYKTFVFADETEYTTAVCTDDESGKVHIRWDKQKEHVGAVYVCYYPVVSAFETVTGEFDTEAEAEAYAHEIQGGYTIPHCCHTTDVKETGCSGAVCKEPECKVDPITRTYRPSLGGASILAGGSVTLSVSNMPPNCSVSWSSNAPGGTFSSSTVGTYTVTASLSCGPVLSATVTVADPLSGANTEAAMKNYSTSNKIKAVDSVSSSSGTVTVITGYSVNCEVPHVTYDKTKCYPGDKEIISISYEINLKDDKYEGDSVYCLQPGATGPGPDSTGLPYIEDMNFDISVCQDQYTNKNDKNAVQCGLAQLLYQTYNCDRTTGKCTPKGEYSNGVITLALRLWMAAYGKDTYSLGTTSELEDNPLLDWIPREDYYQVTADLIKNGCAKTGKKCYDTSYDALQKDKVLGRIGCTKSESAKKSTDPSFKCDIDKAIELFHNTENVKKQDFLGGINFDKKVPVFKYEEDQGIIKVEFDEIEDVEEINVDCKPGEPGCTLKIRFYYGDIDVTDLVELGEWSCEKNTCTAKVIGTKFCLKYKTPGVTVLRAVLEISNWKRNNGYVRFYTHATSPNKYQKMISFGLLLEECEEAQEAQKKLYIPGEVRIDCPCDDKCDDLSSKETDNKECSGYSKITDANMNCIVNACFKIDTYKYNVSSKYIVNPLVCTLYERQENEFYLPEKTSVYAGMQFSYDLGATLGIKTISSNMDPSPKLTSIVKQRKQVTSEINYSFWKSEYDRKLNRLSYAYEQGYSDEYKKQLKAEINEWLFDLKNCNLYTPVQTGASDTRSHAINNILSSANCSGEKCLNMDITYGDVKYGKDVDPLVDISEVLTSDGYELYYCKNNGNEDKCYRFDKNNAVEVKENNKVETVDYYSGKVKIPTNDYATIVIDIEHDFYQATKYKTRAYTGVVEKGEITKGETKKYTPLSDYSYPVSGSSKTGEYPVNIKISNIGNLGRKSTNYAYACKYQVYNRTTAYDCAALDKNGNIDLSKCQDANYKVENGIPKIDDSQISWSSTDSKNNGFVFKNVDLSNLFPNGLDSLNSDVNWTGKEEDIKEIENTADTIFTDESYLQYSYTITPQGMKEIKDYNTNNLSDGGYLNSTLLDCSVINDDTGLQQFRNCKSTFLEEIRSYAGVTVNKEGGSK